MPGLTLLVLAGRLTFGGPDREPVNDRWFARDKLWHFAASAVIQSAGHGVLRSSGRSYPDASRTAAGLTLGIGILKEVWDARGHGDPSWKDLGADVAGTGLGAVLMRQADP
ncbi:MAG: hypothetical protein K1X31_00835 [Gemmatimonadaceae bacterium]|nr:hypothetical protein [Gemmatimonadaceae bacterium]